MSANNGEAIAFRTGTISRSDWHVARLGDICNIVIGKTPRRDNSLFWGGTLPWASISDMRSDVIPNTSEQITDLGAASSRCRLLPAGTLLYSFKLTIGKTAIAGRALYTNEAIAGIIPFDEKVVIPKFLKYVLTTFDPQYVQSQAVKGNTLNLTSLSAISVPLPPLAEQQRIVARVEALAARIAEARELQDEVSSSWQNLLEAILFSDKSAMLTPLSQILQLRKPDVTVQSDQMYHFAGVYSFGRGVFVGQRKQGTEFSYKQLTRLHEANFVYPKLMAWEGALGIVPQDCDGLVVSPEFPVFKLDHDCVLPETLDVYFRRPSVWPLLSGASTGTNARRRRLHPSELLAYKLPLPSMATQHKLRAIKMRADEAHRVRQLAQTELVSLEAAILDRALNGDL